MNSIKLGEIAYSQTGPFGSQLHERDYVDKGTPIVTVEHLGEIGFTHQNLPFVSDQDTLRLSKYLLQESDIVFSRVGSVDRSAYVSEKEEGWLFSGRCIRVRIDKSMACPRFISYYFKQKKFKEMMLNISVGATMPSLNTSLMDNIVLKLPDILVQKKVAYILSNVDKKIELNNKINAELEAMAKTLYDYWFVQFDFPNEDGKSYKSSGGKMVYSEVLKREVPEGWEVNRVADVLKQNSIGLKLSAKYYKAKGKLPIIDQSVSFIAGYTDDENYIIKATRNEPAIVFGDHTRILKLINFDFVRGADGTQLLFSNVKVLPQYLFYHMLSKIDLSNYGYARHFKFLKDTLIILPTFEVAKKFDLNVKLLFDKILINQKQNQELAELRDWLLPMLMNGQVSVGDAVRESKQEVRKDDRVRNLFGDEEYLKRKMLAVYIINQSLNDKSFGRTKFMKLMHLIEYHIVKDNDITKEYYEHAAGPYDGAFANKFWDEVIEDKWYRFEELGKLQRVVRGAKHRETEEYVNFIADDLKQQISDFINLFKVTTYKQPEVVSTLYAVWNNRMIQGEIPPDSLLIEDFLAWDEQKIKYSDVLDKALGWMRANDIVPTGFGSVIKASKSRRG